MRNDSVFSCVMVDIDHFQRINDSYGQLVGDEVLCQVAQVLRDGIRLTDFLGRYGGEEFCMFLPQTNLPNAVFVAERCRRAVAEATYVASQAVERITASFGIATNNSTANSAIEMIRLADQALLEAKRQGRNQVQQVPLMQDVGA